jgi:PBP1b-binding outer membrane lipoprotein LpoB
MKKINIILLLIVSICFCSCTSTSSTDNYNPKETSLTYDINSSQIIENASKLYEAVDGITYYTFYNYNGVFYEKQDGNGQTYEDIINEYKKCFSKNLFNKIFSGQLNKNDSSTIVKGISEDGKSENLSFYETSENYKAYKYIELFNVGRGANFSCVSHYFEKISDSDSERVIKCTALYIANHSENTVEYIYKHNDNWEISADNGKTYTEYIPYGGDYIKEYFYNLIYEDGVWKVDKFELWY